MFNYLFTSSRLTNDLTMVRLNNAIQRIQTFSKNDVELH